MNPSCVTTRRCLLSRRSSSSTPGTRPQLARCCRTHSGETRSSQGPARQKHTRPPPSASGSPPPRRRRGARSDSPPSPPHRACAADGRGTRSSSAGWSVPGARHGAPPSSRVRGKRICAQPRATSAANHPPGNAPLTADRHSRYRRCGAARGPTSFPRRCDSFGGPALPIPPGSAPLDGNMSGYPVPILSR